MIIIGERLNSTRRSVFKALGRKDEEYLLSEARNQEKAGADYIDLNTAALLDREVEALRWAIPLLQSSLNIPLSLDTPNPEAMEAGLQLHKGRALLNSLTGESKSIERLLPLIREYKPGVIVLCLDDKGLPTDAEKELSIAQRMVELLEKAGLDRQDILVDPLVRPIGVDQQSANLFLESLEKIKKHIPGVRAIAGISNVSFGLPGRKLLNRSFLVLALQKGLDAAIFDPLDRGMLSALNSAQALLGHDPFVKDYLSFVRRK